MTGSCARPWTNPLWRSHKKVRKFSHQQNQKKKMKTPLTKQNTFFMLPSSKWHRNREVHLVYILPASNKRSVYSPIYIHTLYIRTFIINSRVFSFFLPFFLSFFLWLCYTHTSVFFLSKFLSIYVIVSTHVCMWVYMSKCVYIRNQTKTAHHREIYIKAIDLKRCKLEIKVN